LPVVNKTPALRVLALGVLCQMLGFFLFTFFAGLITAWAISWIFVLIIFGFYFRRQMKTQFHWGGIFMFLVLFLFYLGEVFLESVRGWDARSIWLFHAKMIYLADGVHGDMGFSNPAIVWSHPDYPMLGPSLEAFFVKLGGGVWNENIARFAWIYLCIPVFCILSEAFQSVSGRFLIAFVCLFCGSFLWNGFMDGYLALYSFTAVVLMNRYIRSRTQSDFILLSVNFGICILLKNEGVLIVLSFLFSTFLFTQFHWSFRKLLFLVASFIPFGAWVIYKRVFQISNDLKLLSSESLGRALSRLSDGHSARYILQSMFQHERGITYLLIVFAIIYKFRNKFFEKPLPNSIFATIFCALFYGVGLFAIYLSTYLDLGMHLHTSIDRTMLSFDLILFGVFAFFIQDNGWAEMA
jgi:hypothetical protein